ncbi:MAG: glycosyltransferase family 2 protein [Alphaproteobacteria bacterium]
MPQVSVVTPSYREAQNIPVLFERLKAALAGFDWELIVVDDDSPDGTAEVARKIAQSDKRMRVVQRLGRRGLSGAVIEGMLASSAPILAVIDSDLQHDEKILPQMIKKLETHPKTELVIGSRYAAGGGIGQFTSDRAAYSKFATRLGNMVTKTHVADPMSGFFAIKREAFMPVAHKLSNEGFKILFDILASSQRPLVIAEIPYEFGERVHGESKLDTAVAWQYVELLLDKLIGRYVPVRLIKFGLVGLSGVVVSLGTVLILFKMFGENFDLSQAIATFMGMTWNYFLNNLFTFKDRRLTGWGVLGGLLSFYAVCSVGALANVGAAGYFFHQEHWAWGVASISGILVGMVWNYAVSSRITWGQRRK